MPDRQGETQTCFVGPINGYWSDTTGMTSSGTTDVYRAKVMCLDSYYCTGITTNAVDIAVWHLVYTCRTNPIGCQIEAGTNGVGPTAQSYYRFDPDGQHGCWLEAPPATPPAPPSPPPPAPCSNLLTDHECRTNYRYAGLCHTVEAARDCALTCGKCHDGCMNREYAWSGWDGTNNFMSQCATQGAIQCQGNSGYAVTDDVLGGPGSTPNGIADGIDSKCTTNIGIACSLACGCCDYIYGDASPPPPPPPPVCEDTGNVACHTAIATLGCDCGGAIANDCYKSCGCCAEQPPPPPPPTDIAIGLNGNDPQDEHTIKWNVNYVFQAYGDLIEVGDWVCWQPIWAPNFEPPSNTPTTYCGTCIGGAYGFPRARGQRPCSGQQGV